MQLIKPKNCLIYFLFLDFVILGLFLISVRIGFGTSLFDLNAESNFPTWYSSSKLLIAALILFFAARATDFKNVSLILLGSILLAMSADEISQIHERIGHKLSLFITDKEWLIGGQPSQHMWPYLFGIPTAIIIAAVLMYCFKTKQMIKTSSFVRIILAFGVFFFAALGLEIVSHFWFSINEIWIGPAPVLTLVEETVENLGSSLLLWASLHIFNNIASETLTVGG